MVVLVAPLGVPGCVEGTAVEVVVGDGVHLEEGTGSVGEGEPFSLWGEGPGDGDDAAAVCVTPARAGGDEGRYSEVEVHSGCGVEAVGKEGAGWSGVEGEVCDRALLEGGRGLGREPCTRKLGVGIAVGAVRRVLRMGGVVEEGPASGGRVQEEGIFGRAAQEGGTSVAVGKIAWEDEIFAAEAAVVVGEEGHGTPLCLQEGT